MTRRVLVALLAAGVAVPLVCTGTAASAAVAPATPYDFDGDGRAELVASAPRLTVEGYQDAGGVVWLPGATGGPSGSAGLITGKTLGSYEEDIAYGALGSGLASADFNRDGYADLVFTSSSYIGWGISVGVLGVVPGSPKGLDLGRRSGLGNPYGQDDWRQSLSSTMVAADLTGDGYPDLAVEGGADSLPGVPGETYQPGGGVLIFAGGPKGLGGKPVRTLRGRLPAGGHQDWDHGFGSSLAVEDVNGDGRLDLVVGSSGGSGRYGVFPGSVSVCFGAAEGPTGCTRVAHSPDLAGSASIAAARVTGASRPDLVVALPQASEGAGAVRILRLTPSGRPDVERTLVLSQSSRGVPGGDEPGDAFGASLAVADLDRDGHDDLVIGSPGENDARGRVTVVHGANKGWRTRGNYFSSQDRKGVPDRAEAGDAFGSAVALLDHDGDGRLDLDVGAPGEDGTGLVTSLRGKGKGFTTKGAKAFGLADLGVTDVEDADFGVPLGG